MAINPIKAKIIYSTSVNPWINLSIEEYLLTNVQTDEVALYLWQNANTVVIGRNQNPWKECNIKALVGDEGKLARRLSGGGAVYHDLGNLNFTFIMNKKYYDIRKQQLVIIDALMKQGIDAVFSGRNDMLIDGRKFSGHAYYDNGTNAYHHGTILVDTNFKKMSTYLNPSAEKIQSKSVESVRSRVINIAEVYPGMTTDQIKRSLADSFAATYGMSASSNFEIIPEVMASLYEKYSSWGWCYGNSPLFDISLGKRFAWGEVEINLTLKLGIITDVRIFTDAMEVKLMDGLSMALPGCPYQKHVLVQQINNNIRDEKIRDDLMEWIQNLMV